jgi:hypothetical protein
MATQETVTARKRRGPKPTGKGLNIGVRFQPAQLAEIDAFIAGQPKPISRPEAIRMLVKRGSFPEPACDRPSSDFPGAASSKSSS